MRLRSVNEWLFTSFFRVKRYLGPVQLHFIKDAWTVRGEGQLGSFFFLLLSEVNAIARAHVAALGGNALLCHRLVPQEAGGKASRNQGYTMFSITGDAVLLEFFVPLAPLLRLAQQQQQQQQLQSGEDQDYEPPRMAQSY